MSIMIQWVRLLRAVRQMQVIVKKNYVVCTVSRVVCQVLLQ